MNTNTKNTRKYDEKRALRRRLKAYREHGAILDEKICRKASDLYWKGGKKWRESSHPWRFAYATAAELASGLRLFEGGYYTHPCGDPDTKSNLEYKAKEVRFYIVEGKSPKWFGAEAVRTYYHNIRSNKDDLIGFGGEDYYDDSIKGIKYAARIFGIDLKEGGAK